MEQQQGKWVRGGGGAFKFVPNPGSFVESYMKRKAKSKKSSAPSALAGASARGAKREKEEKKQRAQGKRVIVPKVKETAGPTPRQAAKGQSRHTTASNRAPSHSHKPKASSERRCGGSNFQKSTAGKRLEANSTKNTRGRRVKKAGAQPPPAPVQREEDGNGDFSTTTSTAFARPGFTKPTVASSAGWHVQDAKGSGGAPKKAKTAAREERKEGRQERATGTAAGIRAEASDKPSWMHISRAATKLLPGNEHGYVKPRLTSRQPTDKAASSKSAVLLESYDPPYRIRPARADMSARTKRRAQAKYAVAGPHGRRGAGPAGLPRKKGRPPSWWAPGGGTAHAKSSSEYGGFHVQGGDASDEEGVPGGCGRGDGSVDSDIEALDVDAMSEISIASMSTEPDHEQQRRDDSRGGTSGTRSYRSSAPPSSRGSARTSAQRQARGEGAAAGRAKFGQSRGPQLGSLLTGARKGGMEPRAVSPVPSLASSAMARARSAQRELDEEKRAAGERMQQQEQDRERKSHRVGRQNASRPAWMAEKTEADFLQGFQSGSDDSRDGRGQGGAAAHLDRPPNSGSPSQRRWARDLWRQDRFLPK